MGEIGLCFFIRLGADKFCTNAFQGVINQIDFFICQSGLVTVKDITESPCRDFLYTLFMIYGV